MALQTCRMDAMRAFYHEAFGFEFRQVDAGGMTCWFGEAAGLVLKLVPLRDEVDFDGYPTHQLGFVVDDPARVAALALRHGFAVVAQEDYIHEVTFTLERYVKFLGLQSNVIAAVEWGTEALADVEGWITGELSPWYPRPAGTFVFGGDIQSLRRATDVGDLV